MEELDYLLKTALSKDEEKLGEIIRIEGSPTSVIISEKPHVIVKVTRLFFSSDYIQLPLELVMEQTATSVQFNISEEEFEQLKQTYRAQRKSRIATSRRRKKFGDDYDKNIAEAEAKQVRRW